MASEATIRNATPQDHATFAELFRELGIDDPVPSLDRFRNDFLPTTLIAERGGLPAGYAFYRPMKDTVHLSHVVSAPAARRTGAGRALMHEVARRARAAGCTHMSLNVRADNTPAIRLYESFGLVATHRNHGLKLEWSIVETNRALATLAEHAHEIAPDEDEALETACALPKGMLAEQRARPGRVLRAIAHEPGKLALTVFDTGFPGTYPFRAPDLRHAWSLLVALRPFAPPDSASVHMMIENDAELSTGLVAAGATLKVEAVFMRGPLP